MQPYIINDFKYKYNNLKSMPNELSNLTSLTTFNIRKCSNLISLI
uniref:Uncharacterized protein n=1 Tax=Physcomitrium patens TaxID=3218 RepID=A0A2K1KGY0_PHYPA|nr:hypothetical protein PHYPA_009417 [Physcomitrium patens]